ncbi:unnamed protein product [Mytilus coruscus]|uniref:Uncharacterized protein n=1 Tax=Mytilus coruscus TaxID=42192 RepID=A0A6J8AT12_MYTCO|nr:unnamed protein product [Mytilus coruscus]
MGKFKKKSEKTLQLERKRKRESLVDTIKGGQQNSMATEPGPEKYSNKPSISRTDYFRTYMQNRGKSRRFTFNQVLDKRNKRKNDSYNQDKNARGSKALKDKHPDEQYRQNERDIDGKARKLNRLDVEFKSNETERETKARKRKRLEPDKQRGPSKPYTENITRSTTRSIQTTFK